MTIGYCDNWILWQIAYYDSLNLQPFIQKYCKNVQIMYRATQHLDSYIMLTSKQKFPRLVGPYCSYLLPTQALSTFNLMSTEYRNQGAVSPCRKEPNLQFPFHKQAEGGRTKIKVNSTILSDYMPLPVQGDTAPWFLYSVDVKLKVDRACVGSR